MPLYRLLQNSAFEPDHIEVMAQAFEAVCTKLHLAKRDDPLRDVVAEKVINWAKRGERNPERLYRSVLSDIQGEAASGGGLVESIKDRKLWRLHKII